MFGHLGERRHRADLETVCVISIADPAHRLDSAQVDHDFGTLDAIFEPVEAVETTGEGPRCFAITAFERQRIVDARRLKELGVTEATSPPCAALSVSHEGVFRRQCTLPNSADPVENSLL